MGTGMTVSVAVGAVVSVGERVAVLVGWGVSPGAGGVFAAVDVDVSATGMERVAVFVGTSVVVVEKLHARMIIVRQINSGKTFLNKGLFLSLRFIQDIYYAKKLKKCSKKRSGTTVRAIS
jgi:hypothetical protein